MIPDGGHVRHIRNERLHLLVVPVAASCVFQCFWKIGADRRFRHSDRETRCQPGGRGTGHKIAHSSTNYLLSIIQSCWVFNDEDILKWFGILVIYFLYWDPFDHGVCSFLEDLAYEQLSRLKWLNQLVRHVMAGRRELTSTYQVHAFIETNQPKPVKQALWFLASCLDKANRELIGHYSNCLRWVSWWTVQSL